MFLKICDFENLLSAFYLSLKDNRDKPNIIDFDFHLESNLEKIRWELETNRYQPSFYKYFVVCDSKKRNIAAPAFRDRVVQHALVSAIEPLFEKRFIFDSYACRKNKGTHFGMKRLKKFLQAARTVNGKEADIFVLKADIKRFFPSISWDILLHLVGKTIACPRTMGLIKKIITVHRPRPMKDRRGLPIGNLTSQLFANVYLNELDHFVKEKLKERWYGRYMDDFFIISADKNHLKIVKDEIQAFLAQNLKLTLHPDKTMIQNAKDGVCFVGYRIFYDHVLIRGSTLLRMQRKLKLRRRQCQSGKISREKYNQTISSFKGHLKHANAWKLQQTLFD